MSGSVGKASPSWASKLLSVTESGVRKVIKSNILSSVVKYISSKKNSRGIAMNQKNSLAINMAFSRIKTPLKPYTIVVFCLSVKEGRVICYF